MAAVTKVLVRGGAWCMVVGDLTDGSNGGGVMDVWLYPFVLPRLATVVQLTLWKGLG